jgi:Fe-S-cluster containining protein
LKAPLPLPVIHIPAHARFDCHGCGACCRSHWRMTVTEPEIERFIHHDWPAEDPRFQDGVLEGKVGADGTLTMKLKQIGIRCIFLDDDEGCRIHKVLGPAAKPDGCQLFPLAGVREPDGAIRVSIRSECESWHRSHAVGTPLARDRATLAPILARFPTISTAPEWLPFGTAGRSLPWEEIAALADRLGALVGAAPTLEAAFAAFGPALAAMDATVPPREPGADPDPGPPPLPVGEAMRFSLALALLLCSRAMKTFEGEASDGPTADAGGDGTDGRAPSFGAAAALALEGEAWRGAFRGLDAEALAFARAAIRAWLEGPALADCASEVQSVVGAIVLLAHILPFYGALFAAAAGRPGSARTSPSPTAADLNLAAKRLSLFVRKGDLAAFVRKAPRSLRALATSYEP